MVAIYVRRIKNGVMLWTDVVPSYQNRVKAELVRQGYICNEDGTVSKADGSDLYSIDNTVAE